MFFSNNYKHKFKKYPSSSLENLPADLLFQILKFVGLTLENVMLFDEISPFIIKKICNSSLYREKIIDTTINCNLLSDYLQKLLSFKLRIDKGGYEIMVYPRHRQFQMVYMTFNMIRKIKMFKLKSVDLKNTDVMDKIDSSVLENTLKECSFLPYVSYEEFLEINNYIKKRHKISKENDQCWREEYKDYSRKYSEKYYKIRNMFFQVYSSYHEGETFSTVLQKQFTISLSIIMFILYIIYVSNKGFLFNYSYIHKYIIEQVGPLMFRLLDWMMEEQNQLSFGMMYILLFSLRALVGFLTLSSIFTTPLCLLYIETIIFPLIISKLLVSTLFSISSLIFPQLTTQVTEFFKESFKNSYKPFRGEEFLNPYDYIKVIDIKSNLNDILNIIKNSGFDCEIDEKKLNKRMFF